MVLIYLCFLRSNKQLYGFVFWTISTFKKHPSFVQISRIQDWDQNGRITVYFSLIKTCFSFKVCVNDPATILFNLRITGKRKCFVYTFVMICKSLSKNSKCSVTRLHQGFCCCYNSFLSSHLRQQPSHYFKPFSSN